MKSSHADHEPKRMASSARQRRIAARDRCILLRRACNDVARGERSNSRPCRWTGRKQPPECLREAFGRELHRLKLPLAIRQRALAQLETPRGSELVELRPADVQRPGLQSVCVLWWFVVFLLV